MLKLRNALRAAAVVAATGTLGGPALAQDTGLVEVPFASTIAVSGPLGDVYVGFVRASAMAFADNKDKLAAVGWKVPENGEYPNEDTQQKVDRAIPTMQLQMARGAKIISSVLTPIVIAQAQAAVRSNVLIFGTYLQGPNLAGLDNFVVGMMLADTEAKPLGNFAATALKAKTAAIIYVDDEYGSRTASTFKEAFSMNGGSVVLELPIPGNPSDFRNEATRVVSANPDIVFIIHRGGYNLAIETLRDSGYEGQLMAGTASLVSGKITPAAAQGKGMIISTVTGSPEARAKFHEQYQQRWNEPLPAESVLIAYAATEVLIEALTKVKGTKDLDVEQLEAEWMKLGTVKTLVGDAVVTGRSVVYPINLEQIGTDDAMNVIGSCNSSECFLSK